ncbi:MAG: hypothetical protein FWF76_00825 [Oscillospiraceae bacterium]|nr:hypothetical protein [Oscillospiraceae bacterium]
MKLRKRLVAMGMAGVMAVSMLGAGVSARQITANRHEIVSSGWHVGGERWASWNDTSTRGRVDTYARFMREINLINGACQNRRNFTSEIFVAGTQPNTRVTIRHGVVYHSTGAVVTPATNHNCPRRFGRHALNRTYRRGTGVRLSTFNTMETVWTTSTFSFHDITGI